MKSNNLKIKGILYYSFGLAIMIIALLVMTRTANAATVTGSCGNNLNWKIVGGDEGGDEGELYTLTISGEGDMYDYTSISNNPWYDYRDIITEIILDDGITRVGNGAFADFTAIKNNLIIPESVTSIGKGAFTGSYFPNVYVYSKTLSVGNYAFLFTNKPTLYVFYDDTNYTNYNAVFGETKFFGDNKAITVTIPKNDDGKIVHKVGIKLTRENGTAFDKELTDYTIDESGNFVFTADIFVNQIVDEKLSYVTYYIYNYEDENFDSQIEAGNYKDNTTNADTSSFPNALFRVVLDEGTLTSSDFNIKEKTTA